MLLYKKKNSFTSEQLQTIEGVMLGDGYMMKSGKNSANFQLEQAHFHKDWVYQIKDLLELDCKIYTRYKTATNGTKGNKCLCYRFIKAGKVFKELHERFYIPKHCFDIAFNYESSTSVKQTKIIPLDLQLTPISLYHWYMGDGTLKGKCPALCTQGFPKVQLEKYIIPQLEQMGIKATLSFINREQYNKKTHGYVVIVKRGSSETFFNMIGPCITDGFQHKWPQ